MRRCLNQTETGS